MRRLTCIATVIALSMALAFSSAADAKKRGPKLTLGAAFAVASEVLQQKRAADPNTIAGEVEPCKRVSRRKATCYSGRHVGGLPELLCNWTTTVWITRHGKGHYKVSPETCGPEPAPFGSP
jgi:hypothetical protein